MDQRAGGREAGRPRCRPHALTRMSDTPLPPGYDFTSKNLMHVTPRVNISVTLHVPQDGLPSTTSLTNHECNPPPHTHTHTGRCLSSTATCTLHATRCCCSGWWRCSRWVLGVLGVVPPGAAAGAAVGAGAAAEAGDGDGVVGRGGLAGGGSWPGWRSRREACPSRVRRRGGACAHEGRTRALPLRRAGAGVRNGHVPRNARPA